MLADFDIPRLCNNMKIAKRKNHLGVKFCTQICTLLKNGVQAKFFQNSSKFSKKKLRNFKIFL